MKKQITGLVSAAFFIILAACNPAAASIKTRESLSTATAETAAWMTRSSIHPTKPQCEGIRWFVGLGTGMDPVQVRAELETVIQFNRSSTCNDMMLEIVPYDAAPEILATQFAAGNGPDIVGPMGWGGTNAFHGQWLDLTPLLAGTRFDTSQFNPALMEMYTEPDGIFGLPFAVYPSILFFNTTLFQAAGLSDPPARYGEKYRMPDGSPVEWNWETLREVAQLLTIDSNGRNATDPRFNKQKIMQYGYTWQYENHPNYWGSFWEGGTLATPGELPKSNQARVPDAWKASWEWTYDGIWGTKPFIPNQLIEESPEYDEGNPFNSNKVAMTVQTYWYTCCMDDVTTWEAAAMPVYEGKVGGRIDADTFRIWKGTKVPEQAFEVLAYLVTDGVQILINGSDTMAAAYGGFPARTANQKEWLEDKKSKYPWVENWNVIVDGLNYPDIPSAEAYVPNYNEAWARGKTFADLLRSTPGLDLDAEITKYLTDLTVIFNT